MAAASSRLHFVLAPFGSAGDVFPFLWLAQGLQARGHHVTLAVPAAFAKAARFLGIRVISMGTEEQYHELARDPLLWHPLIGPWRVVQAARRFFDDYVKTVGRLLEPEGTVLLAPSQNFAMRFLSETMRRPLLTIHLQPFMLMSIEQTPVLMAGLEWLCEAPRWLRRFVIHHAPNPVDICLGRFVRRRCREQGIPAPRRLLTDWWESPLGTICLFPEWFAPPQRDWPARLRMSDFPCFDLPSIDGQGESEVGEKLGHFLATGAPPIVFTGGSAMRTGDRFFREALAACLTTGTRGVFVARYPEQIPADLPPCMLHVPYAPFSKLFPSAAAVVHHGGIGTTSQCFAAGVPQVVVAMSHDQPDNARRVARLGCGIALPHSRANARRLAEAMHSATHTESIRSAASSIAKRMRAPGRAEGAALAVEELVAGYTSRKISA